MPVYKRHHQLPWSQQPLHPALRFIHQDPVVALHYYMAGARAKGNSSSIKSSLLRELLVESKGYGTLLGSGGGLADGGAFKVGACAAGTAAAVMLAVMALTPHTDLC
jgi:hypothetical protein